MESVGLEQQSQLALSRLIVSDFRGYVTKLSLKYKTSPVACRVWCHLQFCLFATRECGVVMFSVTFACVSGKIYKAPRLLSGRVLQVRKSARCHPLSARCGLAFIMTHTAD